MLEQIDLSLKLDHDAYTAQLPDIQLHLVKLQQKLRASERALVIAYEGWDASGKGGSILRITQALDPRGYVVWPIGAPNEVERQYHYLWRFWNRLPAHGHIAIFDRTWYGRVLVERVEKLTAPEAWRRGYREICDFERTLVHNGVIVIKFWLHISKGEQLKRFKERESNPFKRWKIGDDDWRNREKWDDYWRAAEEMIAETSIPESPWHVIPAESKHYARIETAKIVVNTLEQALEKKKGK